MPDPKKRIPAPDEILGSKKIPTPDEVLGVKKKEPSDGAGQPSQEASSTRTDRTRSLSGTEKPQGQKVSDGSDGDYRYEFDPKTRERLGLKSKSTEIIPSFVPKTDEDIRRAEREELYREPVRESTFVAPTKALGKIKESKEELKATVDVAKENAKERAKILAKNKVNHYKSLGDNPNESFSVYNQPPDERDDARRLAEKSFVNNYFNLDDLNELGINPADFDGFLERKGLKESVINRDLEGGFGDKEENKIAKQAYLSNMLKLYLGEKEFVINDYEKSLKQSENPEFGADYKPSYSYDRSKYREYISKNLPDLDRSLKISEDKDKQAYTEILEKQDNPLLEAAYGFKSLGKNILSGIGKAVQDTTPLLYESLGFEDAANDIRDRALANVIESKPKNEASGYVSGREIKYNNRNYLVSNDGTVYDKDLEISVNNKLPKEDIDTIIKESNVKGKDSSIFGVQGLVADFGSVMGDMAWQVAFQAAVSKGTKPIMGSTNKYANFIPKATGDAIIAQGLYGYSTAYEDTLRTAREKGISEEESKNLAKDAAKMTAYLYAATAPIQPGEKYIDLVAGKSIKSIANESVEAYLKNGKQGFVGYLGDVGRTFLKEGGKEAVQENVQQLGETYLINKKINDLAGQEIKKDAYTLEDFVNTSILSMAAGGVLPGISSAVSGTKAGNYNNLYVLGENITKATPVIDELVSGGAISRSDADGLIRKANAIYKNSSKIPANISYDKKAELSVLLEDINELEDKKKMLDPAFHDDVNKQIEEKRAKIKEIASQEEVAPAVVTEEKVVVEQPVSKKNSLSLFQEISDITSKPEMQEFSKQNPDVAFIHNNIEGIIKGIDGAKVVEC